MDNRAEFNSFASSFGNIIPVTGRLAVIGALHPWRDRLNQRVKAGRRLGVPMKLQVGYLPMNDFNAFATHHNGTDIIAVSEAVPMVLRVLIWASLHFPEIMPEVGDLQTCHGHKTSRNLKENAFLFGADVPLPPYDRQRAHLANQLLGLAECVILEHELAHVNHGHVDWIQDQFGLSAVDELQMASVAGLKGIDLQTLEWDADTGAVDRLLAMATNARRVPQSSGHSKLQFPTKNAFGSAATALERLSFVLYITYRIFSGDLISTDLNTIVDSTHPPGIVRMNFNSQMLMHSLHVRAGWPPEKSWPVISRGIDQGELAFSLVTGAPKIDVNSNEVFQVSDALLKAFEDNWYTLHGQLDPYKRGGVLAPPRPL